jgi:hypothetical protein
VQSDKIFLKLSRIEKEGEVSEKESDGQGGSGSCSLYLSSECPWGHWEQPWLSEKAPRTASTHWLCSTHCVKAPAPALTLLLTLPMSLPDLCAGEERVILGFYSSQFLFMTLFLAPHSEAKVAGSLHWPHDHFISLHSMLCERCTFNSVSP